MEPRKVVVIGGSAGSLAPLGQVIAALPPGLPACVAVTIHVGDLARSRLPRILLRLGSLPAAHARMGELLRPGRIYVAPPGCHLLMPAGVVELSTGPRMNRARPAIDAMFASAARWFGDRVVAVILSGMLDDGAVGAGLVEQAGGLVVVQDPKEAARPSMPKAALTAARNAVALPSAGIAGAITAMLPECGGALAESVLPHVTYHRRQVGHQFGPQSLAAAQLETAEAKLWAAVAALEESAVLARHLAGQTEEGQTPTGRRA
jgi:two-component system, chemotaxis family, protein-glutamate methylesterase/glutaminase